MKKLFLLALPFLLTSCSDDESNQETSGLLSKIVSTSYYMGEIEAKYVLDYEDGRPSVANVYNSENEIVWKDTYSYTDGKLSSVTGYEDNTATTNASYVYDIAGRIIEVEHNDPDFSALYSFTYNTDGTVTRTDDSGFERLFHINQEGLVYKQINNNGDVYEVTYDGHNPVLGEGTMSKTFEYLPQSAPQSFIDASFPKYGAVKANAVLADGNLDGNEDAYATKFIQKKVVDGYTTQYYYTFTNDGYPATVKVYHDDELIAETEYVY